MVSALACENKYFTTEKTTINSFFNMKKGNDLYSHGTLTIA